MAKKEQRQPKFHEAISPLTLVGYEETVTSYPRHAPE